VQVDEEQIRLALGRVDDVVVPYLLAQCLAHGLVSLLAVIGSVAPTPRLDAAY
jgi:hypothetical protein